MLPRTLIYARVSTEDQVEKYGLPVQFRACRDYAGAQGLSVMGEIADEGVSGIVLERPGLDRVRAMVRNGEVDVVLMLDVDRLSRELAHLLILKPEIEKRARVQFVAANFEDSPAGRMFFGIRGVIGQYERELTRERTMRGKRERARRGLIVGGRICYGYRYEDGRLVPDPERAPIARQIFTWYDAGVSAREIARRLRAMGAPTWSGKQWGHSSIGRILKNETYAGQAHYGTWRRSGKVLRLRNPETERIALPVPALVERAQWERVQARLRENPAGNCGRPSTAYLLRGVLYCTCGRKMSGDRRRSYRSYRCSGRDSLRFGALPHCRCSVPAGTLDAAAWGALTRKLTDREFLRSTLERHEASLRQVDPEEEARLSLQVRRLKAREESALAMLLDPDFAQDRIKIKRQYQEAQQARLKLEAELAERERSAGVAASGAEWLEETAELLREYIPTLVDPVARQELVRALELRAEWNGEELLMTCFIGGELGIPSSRCAQFPPLKVVVSTRLAA